MGPDRIVGIAIHIVLFPFTEAQVSRVFSSLSVQPANKICTVLRVPSSHNKAPTLSSL